MTDQMTDALVPAGEPQAVGRAERAETAELVLPGMIVDAGAAAVERYLEFFAARIANPRTRAAYGRAVGQFPRVVRGPRAPAGGDRAAPRRRLHPDAPRVGPDRQAAPRGHPHAL